MSKMAFITQRQIDATAWLIKKRLEYSKKRCFTYAGLRKTWKYYHDVRHEIKNDWHTIERTVRKLAEQGLLHRIPNGKIMIFCPNRGFWSLYGEVINE